MTKATTTVLNRIKANGLTTGDLSHEGTSILWLAEGVAAAIKSAVTAYMFNNIEDNFDGLGEVNTTRLAEDAAQASNLYANDADATIPEDVYEWAAEVAERYERAHERFRH